MVSTEQDVAADLQVAVMRLARRLRAEKGDHGLTPTQMSVLASLMRHGPMTPGELAQHERVRPPSMTRTVASLAALDLVTRTPDPDDGRQLIVDLTPHAGELLRADRARRRAWLAERLDGLDAADLELLGRAATVLDRLAGA